jgi:hypothetical protein
MSTYTATLLSNGPVFSRPDVARKDYTYQAVQAYASSSGNYTFTSYSYIDPVAYLYDTSFDPLNPSTNLITYDDNSGINTEFLINAALQSGRKYILVVTTAKLSTEGNVWVSIRGPASVGLTPIFLPTRKAITRASWLVNGVILLSSNRWLYLCCVK